MADFLIYFSGLSVIISIKQRKSNEKIMEVKKDGDTFVLVEDVIRNSSPLVLKETTDDFYYNNIPLELSSDGNSLSFSSLNGGRISTTYLEQKLAQIENNKICCKKLQEELDINNNHMDTKAWNNYIQALSGKVPNDCHLTGYGMRW